MTSGGGILYCLIANGKSVLLTKQLRDGNFVQFAKLIVASSIEQEGDHVRSYYDKSERFAFHCVVFQGLTYMCFARASMDKAVCIDFLYDVAAAFRESYAASLDDTNPEVFEDFEVQLTELMEDFGASSAEAGAVARLDRMRGKQFCGLRDADGCFLPVRAHSVDVTVHGVCAKVTVTKRYRNTGNEPVEVFFTFREDNVAVTSFEVSRGKESLAYAHCEELKSDLAFVVRELTKGGRAAFLLEEADDTDTLNVALGTVAPGAKLKATLTYVMQLEMSGSLYEVFLPSTRVWGGASGAVFALAINVNMKSALEQVTCASGHAVDCEISGSSAVITVDSENLLSVNAELLLFLTVEAPHVPQLMVERFGDTLTLCLGWNPLFKANLAEDTPSEFVFVVDRGRVLQGRKISRIKSALQLWLHSLPPGCSFNIVGFGESVVKLYSSCQPYQDGTLRQAMEFVSSMEADEGVGGTLDAALSCVFADSVDEGTTKQLFVLLAQEAGAERADDVLPLVARGSKTARVYTFALGPRSNQSLARRMAKVSAGFYEYLPSDQFLEAAVVDRVVRSSGPSLTKVAIDWGINGIKEQTPTELPCVFSDNRNFFVAFASAPASVLTSEREFKVSVRGCVSAKMDGRQAVTREVQVASQAVVVARDVVVDDVLQLNWKMHAVAELQWELARSGGGTASAGLRARLVREATQAGINVPGATEFLMISEATHKHDLLARVVPRIEMQHAPRPLDVAVKHVAEPPVVVRPSTPGMPPPRKKDAPRATGADGDKKKSGLWAWIRGSEEEAAAAAAAAAAASATSPAATPAAELRNSRRLTDPGNSDDLDRDPFCKEAATLEQFLQLQRANGRWLSDAPLLTFFQNVLNLPRSEVSTAPRKLKDLLKSLSTQHQNDAWATALAVQALQRFYADSEPTWAGMCAKAKGFLFRAIKRPLSKDTPAASIAADARAVLELASACLANSSGGDSKIEAP